MWCAHCRHNILPGIGGVRWRGLRYCNLACSHAAGDRMHCDHWDCPCSAYARLHRVARGLAGGIAVLRERLMEYGEDALLDYGEYENERANLPYSSNTHGGLEDDEDGGDDLDPDKERRDAQLRRTIGRDDATRLADNTTMLAIAGEMAFRNEAKRRRIDSGHEELRRMLQDLQQQNADLQQRLDASEQRRLQLEAQRG